MRSEMQVLLASPALWASRALMASLGKTASMACRASRARMVLPVLRALQARTARRDRRGRRGRPALLANRAKTAKTVWTARLVAILDPAAAAAASAPSFDLDPQEPHALDECRPPALLTWSPASSVSSARHCMGARVLEIARAFGTAGALRRCPMHATWLRRLRAAAARFGILRPRERFSNVCSALRSNRFAL